MRMFDSKKRNKTHKDATVRGEGERELYAREDCNRSDGAICQVHYKKRKKEKEERKRRMRDRIKLGVERMKRKIKSVTSE